MSSPYSQIMMSVEPAIDVDPHPLFTVYSAGNLGEVAPQRLSPMAWSLVGVPMERATRRLVRRVWGERPWAQGSHFVFMGYFGCRPYHNLSAYAQLATQIPGIGPEDVTAAYFEGVEPPAPRPGGRAGRARRLTAVPWMVREIGALRGSLQRLEEDVTAVEDLARASLGVRSEAGMSEAVLRAGQVLDDAWGAHIVTTTGLVPLMALQRAVNHRLFAHAAQVEPWLNHPRELVWGRLHAFAEGDQTLAAGEFLGSSFYEVADDRDPWRRFAVRHRVTAARATADTGVVPLADAQWGMLEPRRRVVGQALARLLGDTMASREHSKSLVMRALHVHRRLLPELAATWAVDDADWPYLTVEEFRGIHLDRTALSRVPERRAACLRAIEIPMPEHLDLSAPDRRRWAPDAPVTARGVSPGRVTGVVVFPDADDLPEDMPAILVCPSADADVAPLLGYVGGVLTERGSEMSHIAILAREHHLPAVVGCAVAGELKPGDIVTINGSTGEVDVEHHR